MHDTTKKMIKELTESIAVQEPKKQTKNLSDIKISIIEHHHYYYHQMPNPAQNRPIHRK